MSLCVSFYTLKEMNVGVKGQERVFILGSRQNGFVQRIRVYSKNFIYCSMRNMTKLNEKFFKMKRILNLYKNNSHIYTNGVKSISNVL